MNLARGQVLGGDFVLVRPLGEGGMGVVWLAEERPLGRTVALKIMRPADSPTRASRFEREARALAALNHPSILSVLRTGIDAGTGLHYIATQAVLLSPEDIRHLCDEVLRCPYPAWLDSRDSDSGSGGSGSRGSDSSEPSVSGSPLSLADLLDGGKALPEAAVARMARDLVGALTAAHAAGILHRDVKPSNILFDAAGRALLADFGLAKFTDAIAANGGEVSGRGAIPPHVSDSLSFDGTGNPKFLGTPSYAAPEAFKKGVAATPALDWYSLGAVLYEALTGDRPRSLRVPSSYDREHISRAGDPLLRDLLEPDPTRRLADSVVFLRRLARVGCRRSRRWLGPALAGACIAAAVTSQILSGVGNLNPDEPAVPPAPLHAPATSSAKWIPRGPTYLNQTPETYPPVIPAALQPPRLASVWQGENRGPLQLLNTFAFPAVDEKIDWAIRESRKFADIRPFFSEGDAAWSGPERGFFLADGSHSEECARAMAKAKDAYSAAVAKIDAAPISLGAPLPVCRAVALARSAWVSVFCHQLGESDDLYAQALEGVTPLAEHDSELFGPLCSWFLSERAYMKCMEGRFEESIPDLEEALALLESNIIRSKPGCAVQEAVLHASLGGMYRAVGQNEKALEDTSEAINIAEAILASTTSTSSATNRPSTLQQLVDFLAGCHYRRGEILRDLGRRQEAVGSYDSARGLWKSLGGDFRITFCQALSRLGSRYYALEQIEKAAECGAEIVEILKPLAERDPSVFGQQYLIALRNYAKTMGNLGDIAASEAAEGESAAFKEKFGPK